jgi:hypothetical protein
MPKNYQAEYGEFGKKLNSRHIAETFDSSKIENQIRKMLKKTLNEIKTHELSLKLKSVMLKNSHAVKAAKFISSSEAANILKKPDDTMGSVNRANEGRSKINEIIINGENDVKLEKFGRLSLELPVSWYPLDDEY